MITKDDVTVEIVKHNGHINCSTIINYLSHKNSYLLCKTYIGYTKKQAIDMFVEYANRKPKGEYYG